jgi:bifunctional non-homologous end joining protein LigD
VAALPARQAWLDGEIVVLDARGISTFQALQEAVSGEHAADFDYFVFDLLYLDGEDLRGLALLERKAKLRALVSGHSVMHYLDHTGGKGAAVFSRSCKRGLEGLVSKHGDGSYRAGRGHGWLKLRCVQRQEFVIGGFTESDKGLDFGALLLGAHERSGRLAYAGRVGTGFSRKERKNLRARLQAIERPKPPFGRFPAQAVISGVHWVKPALVAEIGFTSRTRDGLLRHPTFQGLREDKPARQVVVETPSRTKAARRSA